MLKAGVELCQAQSRDELKVQMARAFGVPAIGIPEAKWPLFPSVFSFFPPVFFPVPVFGSKNLFSESCLERPKTQG